MLEKDPNNRPKIDDLLNNSLLENVKLDKGRQFGSTVELS
jgi:hypothetical protein